MTSATRFAAQAASAEMHGAFLEGSRLYTECLDNVKKIGNTTSIESEVKQAQTGYVNTRLQLADQAQRALGNPQRMLA